MPIDKEFVLAGQAVFTLELPSEYASDHDLCPHYTFRVTYKEASAKFPPSWFVSLLSGPDNTSDYTYVGMLIPHSGRANNGQEQDS